MTLFLRVLVIFIFSFQFSNCQKNDFVNENKNIRLPGSIVDNDAKKFIIGKWEGKTCYRGEENSFDMTLTFQPDGKMIEVDTITNRSNSQNVGTRELSYEFIANDIIRIPDYSDDLRIFKISNNEIHLGKDPSKAHEESIEMIYVCRFKRVSN